MYKDTAHTILMRTEKVLEQGGYCRDQYDRSYRRGIDHKDLQRGTDRYGIAHCLIGALAHAARLPEGGYAAFCGNVHSTRMRNSNKALVGAYKLLNEAAHRLGGSPHPKGRAEALSERTNKRMVLRCVRMAIQMAECEVLPPEPISDEPVGSLWGTLAEERPVDRFVNALLRHGGRVVCSREEDREIELV